MSHLLSEPAAGGGVRRRRLRWRLALLLSPLLFGPAPAATAPPATVAAATPAAADASATDCLLLRRRGDRPGLREQQRALIAALEPAPSLDEVLLRADQLLACAAPQAALDVLARVAPAPGAGRRRWLVMQWRAAQAGLRHDLAVQALTLLAAGDLQRLEDLPLPVGPPDRQGADPDTRSALDLLADHLESLGQRRRAAQTLLASSSPGAATAARWGRAVALGDTLPLRQRDQILETALEQAAAAGAWGLVAALLDQQLAAGVSDEASRQALERRLRLGQRLDDAYGEWLQRRRLGGPEHDSRNLELEQLLRSPRDSGGHAMPLPAPAPARSSIPQP